MTEKSPPKPIVFMFQPTEFIPVKPDKLAEWEENLATVVGPNAPEIRKLLIRNDYLVETTSICHPGGACDCDVHEIPEA